jgi:hypothetical protein
MLEPLFLPWLVHCHLKHCMSHLWQFELCIECNTLMDILVTVQVNASSKFIGLAIVFTAGACYSIFSPAFNLSTNDQWHKLAPGVDKLVIYTAFFYFSLAFFGCAVLINICFLYKPAFGVPKSSIGGYLKDWNGRWIALLAGILCGWGNGFQFMGGQAAGYAAADAVQVRFNLVLHVFQCMFLHTGGKSCVRLLVKIL